jgi:Lon protease-like protein
MKDLPLFPLNTVLFPGGRLPLRIFEQRYMDMAKVCLRDGSAFARIGAWDMPQLGMLHITACGEQRFRILERRVQGDGLALASIKLLEDDADSAVPESCSGCVKLLERVIEQQSGLFEAPHRLDSASWVSSRLAELLPLPLPAKQELLELSDARARIERLNALLRPTGEGL